MANSKKKCKLRGCKEYLRDGEGHIVPAGQFCSKAHAEQFVINFYSKKHKKKELEVKRETKKKKFELMSHRAKLEYAQPIFNKMRKLEELLYFKTIGKEPVCISCQKPLGNDVWCAGHFKTAGEHTNTRFDRKNVYLQHNNRCNKHKSGDIKGYEKGLRLRFGEKEGQEIIDYCERESKKIKRFSDEEILSMVKEWRKKIKALEKELYS